MFFFPSDQVQYEDQVVHVPVAKHVHVPMVQTVQKQIEVPQIEYQDEIVEVPVQIHDCKQPTFQTQNKRAFESTTPNRCHPRKQINVPMIQKVERCSAPFVVGVDRANISRSVDVPQIEYEDQVGQKGTFKNFQRPFSVSTEGFATFVFLRSEKTMASTEQKPQTTPRLQVVQVPLAKQAAFRVSDRCEDF